MKRAGWRLFTGYSSGFFLLRGTYGRYRAVHSIATHVAHACFKKKVHHGNPSYLDEPPELAPAAQRADFSGSQQDVPKDFLIGSRATWQDINSRGGIRARQVTHATVETDGTQPAPMVNASVPVVRQYRETLVRLFDEPPAPHSLACFIAARCTFEVLNNIDGPLTRQSALAGFRSRASLSIGSFRVSFDATRRCGGYVTQSMMAQDGRLIG